MDVGIAPRHQLAVVPDDAIDFVERNSHSLSPGSALIARLAPWRCWLRLAHLLPALRPAPMPAWSLGHAFAECRSPVLFAEMPLDNRTVDKFAAVAASQAACNVTANETTSYFV